MAELTNAQVALQASVESYRRVEGDSRSFAADSSEIMSRAGVFVAWLDKADKRN